MAFDRLVEAARGGSPLLRAAAFAASAFVVTLGLQALAGLAGPAPGLGLGANLLSFVGLIGLTWLFTRFVDRRPFASIGLWSRDFTFHWARGFLLGLAMFALTAAIPAIFGAVQMAQAPSASRLLVPLIGLLFFLIQGPAEEIVVRGYLLPTVAAGSSVRTAVVITSAYFAFSHALNPNAAPLSVLNLFLAGAFLALYFIAEGDLWGVFGWHTAWNWAEGPLLGLPVSGIDVPSPLVDLNATSGWTWLTGGAFGPEGGVAATVVLAAGIGYLVAQQLR